ncbi:hypothetical protein [Pseudomonas abietaniphila]|nr:hypothetical protein [Pseudomonas abietaniphila]
MARNRDIKLSDVQEAVDFLNRNNSRISIAAVHKILGRGTHQSVKLLLSMVLEPAAERMSRIEYSDSAIQKLLSENANLNAGVPGQLVELMDEIGQLHDRLDTTFDHATRILSLVQTVILENLNAISLLSSEQERIRKDMSELRNILKKRDRS